MDWSSVFEDEGEEAGNWAREHELSSRTSMLDKLNGQYNHWICYAFTVNYILGVGCLGIPYAFYQSGIFLGTILVLLLSFVSYVTVMWVAVAAEQEVSISVYQAISNPFILSPTTTIAKRRKLIPLKSQNDSFNNESKLSLLTKIFPNYGSESYDSDPIHLHQKREIAESKSRKVLDNKGDASKLLREIRELEVTDLTETFLGATGKYSYQISLMLLTYVGLLAYAQVFNDAFLSLVCVSCTKIFPAVLFGCLVVPLSCYDLSEQIIAQLIMSLLRFVSLAVLLFGTVFALIFDWNNAAMNMNNANFANIPIINLNGFSVMFTTALFSQLFQHSVPGLIRPLSDEHKKHVPQIFFYALMTTALIYIVSGIVCVLYFGNKLKQSVNLNFIGFTWGIAPHNSILLFGLRAISMIVALFPALDTLSVFPLIAITLGNNLNSAFPALQIALSNQAYQLKDPKRITIVIWRLIASIPPIACSVVIKDLTMSLQVAGLCGIIVALVIPALLHQQTQHRVQFIPTGLQSKLGFQNTFVSVQYVYIVILFAITALGVSALQMLAAFHIS